jgi:hypothetical protein
LTHPLTRDEGHRQDDDRHAEARPLVAMSNPDPLHQHQDRIGQAADDAARRRLEREHADAIRRHQESFVAQRHLARHHRTDAMDRGPTESLQGNPPGGPDTGMATGEALAPIYRRFK